MMLQLVRRPYRLTKEFERAHIQLTRTWWTPLLEYQQARSFEQFALHIRAVNRSIKTAVIVGFAAAYIHGIPTLNKEKCLVVCLNLPGDRHPPSSRQCTEIMHYRDAALPESDITEVSGKRVTTIERTFVDFCVMYDELESLAFVEAAMRNGNSHEQFQEYLHEHAGQRGVAKAQRILDRAYDIIDSVQETSMCYQMEAQFPTHKISPQVMIGNYRVDHLMDDYIIVELDGRVKYTEEFAWENGTTVTEIFRKQVSRERYLLSLGYHVLRFYPDELDDLLIPTIRRILAQNPHRISPNEHYDPHSDGPPPWTSRWAS